MSSRRTRVAPSPRRQRGVALVIVLWLTVLLTVVAGTFAFAMRNEALAARNAVAIAQARTLADGALERAVLELTRPRTPDAWSPNGLPHTWRDGDAQLTVVAVDESARIDLNTAAEALLKNVLVTLGGLDDAAASALLDAIVDWRDPDELRRPNGAEAGDYRAANSQYAPANHRFETIGELTRVLGMSPALYARIAGVLTVHSRQAGLNALTANRDALLALPGATPETVDAYLGQRAEALAARLPPPPFPPAQAFPAGAFGVWRIRAEATLPDGVTFVREAVVRPTADPRRPFYALLWSESDRLSPPPAAASASTSAPSERDAPRS